MEEFVMEHGGIIVSGIVSVLSIVIILMIMVSVAHMEAYTLSGIVGG